MKTKATSLLTALMLFSGIVLARTPENTPGKSESAWLSQQVRLTVCERLQAQAPTLPYHLIPEKATLHLEVLPNGHINVLGTSAGDERFSNWLATTLQGIRCTQECTGSTFLLTVRFK